MCFRSLTHPLRLRNQRQIREEEVCPAFWCCQRYKINACVLWFLFFYYLLILWSSCLQVYIISQSLGDNIETEKEVAIWFLLYILNKPHWELFPPIKNVFSVFRINFLLECFIAPLWRFFCLFVQGFLQFLEILWKLDWVTVQIKDTSGRRYNVKDMIMKCSTRFRKVLPTFAFTSLTAKSEIQQ